MDEKHIALNPFPLMLFACGSNKSFAEKVASQMGLELEKTVYKQFADGDFLVHQADTIRDRNLFVICQPEKGDLKYKDIMECMVLVSSLRQGSPKSWITVIMPYLPLSRQDKASNPREPILAQKIPLMLQSIGANQIVVVKLHNPASRTVFPLIKMEDINTTDIVLKFIKKNYPDLSNIKLAAPDVGASKSVREIAQDLGVKFIILDKDRDTKSANSTSVVEVIGDPEGYHIIIIDDIADTCGTIRDGSKALMDKGALGVDAIFTHPVFSKGCTENLNDAKLGRIVFTNSLSVSPEILSALPNHEIIDITQITGQTIANLHNGESVGSLWENGNGVAKENQSRTSN